MNLIDYSSSTLYTVKQPNKQYNYGSIFKQKDAVR